MGCCCFKPPDLELLKQDPSVLGCVKTTSYLQATLSRKYPNVAIKRITNNFGGDVVYFRKDHLGHISCCSCCEGQFPLDQVTKVEVVKNQYVGIGARRGVLIDLGVSITFQHSEDRYTVVAFGTHEAEEFASRLAHDGLNQEKCLF